MTKTFFFFFFCIPLPLIIHLDNSVSFGIKRNNMAEFVGLQKFPKGMPQAHTVGSGPLNIKKNRFKYLCACECTSLSLPLSLSVCLSIYLSIYTSVCTPLVQTMDTLYHNYRLTVSTIARLIRQHSKFDEKSVYTYV